MRVAIIISRIEQLGPVKVIQALVNSFSKYQKLQIKVFYLDKTVDPSIKMIVPVERLNFRTFPFDDYDIIHTNGIRPDLFAFVNRNKIKYHISTIHNFVFDDLAFAYNRPVSWIFGNIWLLLWKRTDKLICVSITMKSYYEKWFSSSKLEVIHNGIAESNNLLVPDNDVIEAIGSFRSRGLKVIGSAGILSRRKGVDQILHLLKEVNELALVIIGNGKELHDLKRLAKKLEITNRCLFCGIRSNAVNYFKYFDLFILPSRSEGFGLALIEAVQQKVPVICSDLMVFKELFNSDEITFFKLEDIISLTESLHLLEKTRKMKVDLAYTRYLNNYTDRLMAKLYCELYKSA